jgi:hypothetical protein
VLCVLPTLQVLFERARSLSAGGLPSVASAAAATPVPLVTGSRASASRATTARLGRSSKRGSGYSARESASDLESRAKREWAQAEALTKEAAAEVLGGAQVVVATCSGAGDPAIANRWEGGTDGGRGLAVGLRQGRCTLGRAP